MSITVQMTGIEAIQRRLQQIQQETLPAVSSALYREANNIMGESVTLVPVLTGLLRSTAHVEQPQQHGQHVSVQLSYGSHGTAPYAVIVEFRQDVNHPNGGQAFYLSQPFFASVAWLAERLATALRARMGSLG